MAQPPAVASVRQSRRPRFGIVGATEPASRSRSQRRGNSQSCRVLLDYDLHLGDSLRACGDVTESRVAEVQVEDGSYDNDTIMENAGEVNAGGVQNMEYEVDTLWEVVCDVELAEIQGAAAGYLEVSIGDVIKVVYVGRKGEDIGWFYGVLEVKRCTGETPRTCGWIAAWAVRRMRPPWDLRAGMTRTEEEQWLHEDTVRRCEMDVRGLQDV